MVELIDRGIIHDQSKYGSVEYIPYVWMTWCYKEKDNGFDYPTKEIKKSTVAAWKHHESVNSHHPGYHGDVGDMTDIDIAEMVCDLAAMSQEYGGNPQEYFDNNVATKYNFSDEQINTIKRLFSILYH